MKTKQYIFLLISLVIVFSALLNHERALFNRKEATYAQTIVEMSDAVAVLEKDLDETLQTLIATQDALDEARRTNINITDSLSLVYAGDFLTTAYCTEKYPHICGEGKGITSSGAKVKAGITVAADPNIFPYGTVLYIEGVGIRVVQDTGSAITNHKLDVAVDTHENALKWSGYGTHRVYIVK